MMLPKFIELRSENWLIKINILLEIEMQKFQFISARRKFNYKKFTSP